MTAGEALARDNMAGFNCAYLTVDHPRAFDEMMYILMCGTGEGFSVERMYVQRLPEVPETFHKTDTVIDVADSKVGWAKAFKELLSLLWAGQVPAWDVSKVRPSGARLKVFGGRASGAEPLDSLFRFTVNLFTHAAGRKLTDLECHDLCCKIADIVVVGGVRRSALISLSNLGSDRMRKAKMGQWWDEYPHRALANNSVVYTEKPDFQTFLAEWSALYESKCGERGIISRPALERQVTKYGRREGGHQWGINPCCFTGDMRLLTSEGYQRFDSLEGKSVSIVNINGDITKGSVWCSGEKEVVEVRFAGEKSSITCTPDHVFLTAGGEEVQALDLKGERLMPHYLYKKEWDDEDAFLAGYIQGDGAATRLNSAKHKGLEVHFGAKDGDIAEMFCQKVGVWYSREAKAIAEQFCIKAKILPERGFPKYFPYQFGHRGTGNSINADFLAGMYSANGCVIKGHRIAYKTTCRELADDLSSHLLNLFGIESYITVNKPTKVVFNNGEYTCRESYDVNISRFESVLKFATTIGFGQKYKQEALHKLVLAKAPMVSSVNPVGIAKVYDFTEPDTHWGIVEGVVVHNSEIILRPNQVCNLSEVVLRADDTKETIREKVVVATILGTLQSTLTNFRYLRSIWKKNAEEERLLGVSLTGICDNKFMADYNNDELKLFLEELRVLAVETNKDWAARLGINPSAAITCVKPSGTVSQLVNSSSGIHGRFSPYYIRRVRADKKDPLAIAMKQQGVPCEDDRHNPSVYVFSFPQKAPKGSVVASEETAIQQLERWKVYAENWCEHKPSVTIYYSDDEFMEVGQWVWDNFDILSGVSFLPRTDHVYEQAPYEAITKEEYTQLTKDMPVLDWDVLNQLELDDMTEGSQTLACVGGSCEL